MLTMYGAWPLIGKSVHVCYKRYVHMFAILKFIIYIHRRQLCDHMCGVLCLYPSISRPPHGLSTHGREGGSVVCFGPPQSHPPSCTPCCANWEGGIREVLGHTWVTSTYSMHTSVYAFTHIVTVRVFFP